MNFHVTYLHSFGGQVHMYYLRGTIWTGAKERADSFPTREGAEYAAKIAEKFMVPAIRKTYRVEGL